MPSKSEKQRRYIFALRGKYKTEKNTPDKEKWIWDDDWKKIENEMTNNLSFDFNPHIEFGGDGVDPFSLIVKDHDKKEIYYFKGLTDRGLKDINQMKKKSLLDALNFAKKNFTHDIVKENLKESNTDDIEKWFSQKNIKYKKLNNGFKLFDYDYNQQDAEDLKKDNWILRFDKNKDYFYIVKDVIQVQGYSKRGTKPTLNIKKESEQLKESITEAIINELIGPDSNKGPDDKNHIKDYLTFFDIYVEDEDEIIIEFKVNTFDHDFYMKNQEDVQYVIKNKSILRKEIFDAIDKIIPLQSAEYSDFNIDDNAIFKWSFKTEHALTGRYLIDMKNKFKSVFQNKKYPLRIQIYQPKLTNDSINEIEEKPEPNVWGVEGSQDIYDEFVKKKKTHQQGLITTGTSYPDEITSHVSSVVEKTLEKLKEEKNKNEFKSKIKN